MMQTDLVFESSSSRTLARIKTILEKDFSLISVARSSKRIKSGITSLARLHIELSGCDDATQNLSESLVVLKENLAGLMAVVQSSPQIGAYVLVMASCGGEAVFQRSINFNTEFYQTLSLLNCSLTVSIFPIAN